MGGCLVFVAYTLWMGRWHLLAVWRKAWGGERDLDDSGELLSYRVAVFGFLGSLTFIAVWLGASGIPLFILPLFLATCHRAQAFSALYLIGNLLAMRNPQLGLIIKQIDVRRGTVLQQIDHPLRLGSEMWKGGIRLLRPRLAPK